jgi:hypothetical protein
MFIFPSAVPRETKYTMCLCLLSSQVLLTAESRKNIQVPLVSNDNFAHEITDNTNLFAEIPLSEIYVIFRIQCKLKLN